MSQQSILEKSLQIRNETQEYANTRGRVADVLDDINETKANRDEVTEEIDEAIEALGISSKIDKPVWDGAVKFYLVKSDPGNSNLLQVSLSGANVPYWTGSNFTDSGIQISASGLRVGIGAQAVSEKLEVFGNAKANAFIIPVNATSATAYRFRSDGSDLYYANGSAVEKRIAYQDNLASVFVYTPTGNFNLSTVKALVEAAKLIFNDIHLIIALGVNNYTMTIDIGSSNPNTIFTFERTGTGTLTVASNRTLTASFNIITLAGREDSMGIAQLKSTIDFITISIK